MTEKKKVKSDAPEIPIDLNDLPGAVLLTAPDHRILKANEAALKFLGYSAKELAGWPLEKIFPEIPKGLLRALAGEPTEAEFQIRVRRSSGKLAIMDFMAAPIVRRGQLTAILHIGRNARVRRLVEAEIKRSRNYFGSIFENSPYGICVTDSRRRIMIANKAAEELTGYGRKELIGRAVMNFYPLGETVDSLDQETLKRGERVVQRLRFRQKNGEEVPVKVSQSLVVDPVDRTDIIIESYSDQTDRLRVDQLKNEFVYVAAHELRNPVSAIRMLVDIIYNDKRVTVEPVLRGYLAKIQEANERLLNLVEDLLEVSRTEAGRLKIHVGPQDIVAIVNGLLSELRPGAAAKGLTIRYSPPAQLPRVAADEIKLKEILTNLIGNAIKYNVTEGSVTIEHMIEEGLLVTRVSDTGIGISEADRQKLFQKFWRSEDMAVRAQAGTGLGLFIVKELVERMGGRIWVESHHGEGSIFSFSLPTAG